MSYEDHRSRQQNQAEIEWNRWFNSLSHAEQDELRKKNLHLPPVDKESVGGKSPYQNKDTAESSLAAYTPDLADELDTEEMLIAEKFSVSLETASEIIQWHNSISEQHSKLREARRTQHIVSGILMSDNPRLCCAGLAFATNLDTLNNLNQHDFAKEYNISRSNVSKSVKHWQTVLDLPTSVHQKSEEACATYTTNKQKSHWRNSIFKSRKNQQPN